MIRIIGMIMDMVSQTNLGLKIGGIKNNGMKIPNGKDSGHGTPQMEDHSWPFTAGSPATHNGGNLITKTFNGGPCKHQLGSEPTF